MNHGNQRHKAVSMGQPHFSVFGTSFWSNPALNSRTFSCPKTINLPHSMGWVVVLKVLQFQHPAAVESSRLVLNTTVDLSYDRLSRTHTGCTRN